MSRNNAPNIDSDGNGIGDAVNQSRRTMSKIQLWDCQGEEQPGRTFIDSDGDGIGDACDEDDDQMAY